MIPQLVTVATPSRQHRTGGDAVTTPACEVQVECEACGEIYSDWRRDSVNLMVSPMTEEEVKEQLSTRCPTCATVTSDSG